MRQSEIPFKTRKEPPKDEAAINAQLLSRAGFVDKVMAGVYTFLPLGLRVMKKIEKIIREEMAAAGGEELLMPILQPKALWEQTGRWKDFDSLFKFTSTNSGIEVALGPTHEEVITPLIGKANLSYKDLPIYLFQIQNKFRDESRAKSGLLRGREFLMKDLYSFHADESDLESYYKKMGQAYRTIFNRAGIGDLTYYTLASGGTFSKYSHEFQTLCPAGEDTIHICKACHTAVNDELIGEQSSCPECGAKSLEKEKAIEVGNIFKLGTKYSSAFKLTYKDKNGPDKAVVMGCYGIGLSRLMGTIVEVYHDENGMIWPESVAPAQVHLMTVGSPDAELKKSAEHVYNTLVRSGIEVLYDDREDVSAGEKFADADLIGLPWRVVLSEKLLSKKQIEIKRRSEKKAEIIDEKDLVRAVSAVA
ncbi:MAG: aminoacyl--tRNA ligase-related protein [Candidatus Jorgensenbacteria bacterium]|nr:aminoacyl--tRNA ligase-related protein [Candidatus Jorgensenbacteria bacterium]